MAPKWTSQRDQNLLLLIIGPLKLDYNDLVARWAKKFPDEEFQPTAKAVSEHIAKLKRDMSKGSGASPTSGNTHNTVRSTPAGKTKTKAPPKTPTSKGKRSRAEMMSDQDDSEDEKNMKFDTPTSKRTTPSRHSVARRYKEEPSDGDEVEDEDDVLITSAHPVRTRDAESDKPFNGDIDSPRPSIARSKKNPPNLDYFKDDDTSATEGSDFEPLT